MSIVKALSKIQMELKAPKGQVNKFGNYKYRSAEDILESVKPLTTKEGLILTLSDEIQMIGDRVYVKATATLTDGEHVVTTEAFAREEEVKKGMDSSQITGAASSYARKYALNGLFCIDDTKDSDATNDHGHSAPRAKSKPRKSAQSTEDSPEVLYKKGLEHIKASSDKGSAAEAVLNKYGSEFTDEQRSKIEALGMLAEKIE